MKSCLWRNLLTFDFVMDLRWAHKGHSLEKVSTQPPKFWQQGNGCRLSSSIPLGGMMCACITWIFPRRDVTATQHDVCHSHHPMTPLKAWTNSLSLAAQLQWWLKNSQKLMEEQRLSDHSTKWNHSSKWKEGWSCTRCPYLTTDSTFPPPPIMKSELQRNVCTML